MIDLLHELIFLACNCSRCESSVLTCSDSDVVRGTTDISVLFLPVDTPIWEGKLANVKGLLQMRAPRDASHHIQQRAVWFTQQWYAVQFLLKVSPNGWE
jgi:hypothetical protein